jgi:hypothetical protein
MLGAAAAILVLAGCGTVSATQNGAQLTAVSDAKACDLPTAPPGLA